MLRLLWPLLTFLLWPSPLAAQEPVDTAMVRRIMAEARQGSQAMDYAFFLSDVYGPRLTGSPAYREAGEWVMGRLREMGLSNVHPERIDWGTGWSLKRFSLEQLEPQYASLIGIALPWSSGTRGAAVGEAVFAPLPTWQSEPEEFESFFEKYSGKLKGKVVLATAPIGYQPGDAPKRLSDEEMADWIKQMEAAARKEEPSSGPMPDIAGIQRRQSALNKFLVGEGVVGVLMQSEHGGGTVIQFGSDFVRMQPAWLREGGYALPPPSAILAAEPYRRMVRLTERGIPVRLRLALEPELHGNPANAYNIVAEIPGGKKREELVLIGAHFDSWTGGTGASDNAAGAAVVMEAMRILQALEVKPHRTIRMALWGGHEGAGLGSRTYVREHFAEGYPLSELEEYRAGVKFKPRPGHESLSAYFNLDHGAGRIRGIYLQKNEAVRPIFDAWLAPFKPMQARHTSNTEAGGTDHLAFDNVGLPGFQFIQDRNAFGIWTHHSNMDVFDYLNKEDLQQSAMILASFAYHTAMRDQLLPRKRQTDKMGGKPKRSTRTSR